MAPRPFASVYALDHAAMVASRTARWVSGVGGEVRHRRERRVEADLRVGDDLAHRVQGHGHERGERVVLGRERRLTHDRVPGPGRGTMSSTVRMLTGDPLELQLDRLVVDDTPSTASTWSLGEGDGLACSTGTA